MGGQWCAVNLLSIWCVSAMHFGRSCCVVCVTQALRLGHEFAQITQVAGEGTCVKTTSELSDQFMREEDLCSMSAAVISVSAEEVMQRPKPDETQITVCTTILPSTVEGMMGNLRHTHKQLRDSCVPFLCLVFIQRYMV